MPKCKVCHQQIAAVVVVCRECGTKLCLECRKSWSADNCHDLVTTLTFKFASESEALVFLEQLEDDQTPVTLGTKAIPKNNANNNKKAQ